MISTCQNFCTYNNRQKKTCSVRIPREFEEVYAAEREAQARYQPVVKGGIVALLASWEPFDDDLIPLRQKRVKI